MDHKLEQSRTRLNELRHKRLQQALENNREAVQAVPKAESDFNAARREHAQLQDEFRKRWDLFRNRRSVEQQRKQFEAPARQAVENATAALRAAEKAFKAEQTRLDRLLQVERAKLTAAYEVKQAAEAKLRTVQEDWHKQAGKAGETVRLAEQRLKLLQEGRDLARQRAEASRNTLQAAQAEVRAPIT